MRDRRAAFLPFERGWALAMTVGAKGVIKETTPGTGVSRLRSRYRGFRGANLAIGQFRRTAKDALLQPCDYRFLAGQSAQGGLGAYLVTLHYGGFVDRSTLTLREPGRALSHAFLGQMRRKAHRLHTPDLVTRKLLADLGQEFDLGAPSASERKLIRDELFGGTGQLADVCRRMTTRSGRWSSAEEALQRLANPDGDRFERAAQYALDFDRMRRQALCTFALLGTHLTVAARQTKFADLAPDVADSAVELQQAAFVLAQRSPPGSVAELARLAHRLAEAPTEPAIVSALLAWHSQVRSAWITEVRPEVYELRRHGTFHESHNFHGYTVESALAMRSEALGTGL